MLERGSFTVDMFCRQLSKAAKGSPLLTRAFLGARRDPLMAFGEPLFAKEGKSLENFHGRYVQAVERLFEKCVGMSADPRHKLAII